MNATPPPPSPSTPPSWDPGQYLRHAGHRSRPLHDLLARVPEVPHPDAPRIADLGCGPGGPSALLTGRWPGAHVTGYDNSPEMLDQARAWAGRTAAGGRLDFAHADLATWHPDPATPFDLLFSNAALQWLPGHAGRFADWLEGLAPGGVLAFQVPGNFRAPSHTLLRQLRESPRWRSRLGGGASRADDVLDPAEYLAALTRLGCEVDAWETTYLHVLPGAEEDDPVLDWVKGTALRPVLTLLADDPDARDAFLDEYRTALRAAYPSLPDGSGTPFPFRRIFVVAVRKG